MGSVLISHNLRGEEIKWFDGEFECLKVDVLSLSWGDFLNPPDFKFWSRVLVVLGTFHSPVSHELLIQVSRISIEKID